MPSDRRMRTCSRCGGRFNFIDWANHQFAHLSPEDQEELRRQMRERKKEVKPMTAEDWARLTRGE